MEDVPKIVQARLAAPPPSEHPDANLLSAFSEGALFVRERGEVLQHLSVCSTCREIASLALPEREQEIAMAAAAGMAPRAMVAAPAALTAPRHGFSLRWGALAACAVIVAGIVFLTRHPKQATVAVLPPGTITASKAPEQQVAEVLKQAEPLRMETRSPQANEHRAPSRAAAKPASPLDEAFKSSGRAGVSSPMESASGIGSGSGAGIGPAAPPPPQIAEVGDRPKPAEIQADSTVRTANTSLAKAESAAPAAPRKQDALQAKEKDKKSVLSTAEFSSATVNGMRNADLSVASVRWILSDGKLRRSSDAGATWENIPFDQDGQFRALSVMGMELWVGGARGVLYHSVDNGAQWVHVIPTASNEALAEDIVRIDFSDSRHGKLITSHGEWRTSNSGASWHKK
ncbi:MAG TPA: YCF48-related protein [Terriglobales bacterium]|jgi:cytoskeletal protein RodZ|nr:YCF48-related protein [Terriglobales bacterium]